MEKQRGFIKSKMSSRGFGFIRKEDGTDIFFHHSGVINPTFDEMREGHIVEFMATVGHKGEKAIGVKVVEGE